MTYISGLEDLIELKSNTRICRQFFIQIKALFTHQNRITRCCPCMVLGVQCREPGLRRTMPQWRRSMVGSNPKYSLTYTSQGKSLLPKKSMSISSFLTKNVRRILFVILRQNSTKRNTRPNADKAFMPRKPLYNERPV